MSNALPKQVRDQIKAADDILDQIKAAEVASPTPAPNLADTITEVAPTPEVPPNDPSSGDQAPTKEPEPDPDHKYKVLQGKYNAEVPRLQKANVHLEDQNRDLNQRILNVEGMLASLAATKDTPPEPKKPELPDVTDEERAQFGDDLIDLMERVAKRATVPEMKDRIEEISKTVQQQGEKLAHSEQDVAESRRRDTVSALATAVPNWAAQNDDPKFLGWLNEVEPSAGVPRGRLLTEAFRANDADRVIWFFKSFQGENATVTGETTPGIIPEPQSKLDDLVAPGTPKTGSVVAPNESGKRVWTRADITALYAQKNEFIKRGKKVPDDLVKLERDLFKAQHEGRLR